jgi:hypothetical protein
LFHAFVFGVGAFAGGAGRGAMALPVTLGLLGF